MLGRVLLPDRVIRVAHRILHAVRPLIEEAGAIRPGTRLARDFGSFGEASLINHPVGSLVGTRNMHIGAETLIGRGCTLATGYGPGDPHTPARALVIGDRCIIGAGAVVTAHESVEISNDVWFGNQVFVSDAGHGYQDTETPIGRQLGSAAAVSIGTGSWIGHGAIILPGSRIGRQVVIGAGSVVRGVIPDHSVAVGVPAKVVRRLEPGTGWVAAHDPADVRPAWTPEEAAATLAGQVTAEATGCVTDEAVTPG